MKKILGLGMLSVSAITLSAGAALADYELNILHINDFHSRIESINKFDSTCSAEEEGKNECFGGAARLLTAINQTRDALKAGGKMFSCSMPATISGLAVLHHLQGDGGSGSAERHEVRRHDCRQPRVRR